MRSTATVVVNYFCGVVGVKRSGDVGACWATQLSACVQCGGVVVRACGGAISIIEEDLDALSVDADEYIVRVALASPTEVMQDACASFGIRSS